MNTLEINKILHRCLWTRPYYRGCFSADEIPASATNGRAWCAVLNMDSRAEPGSHWVAMYKPAGSDDQIDYYDSLGDWPPPSPHIDEFLKRYRHVNRCQGPPLQSDRSGACGRHAIYFLVHRCRGWTLERIVRHLRRCRSTPDRLVNAFVRKFIFNESDF